MPNTFPGNLPYPNSFDPVANGAQNIQDLAEAVNDGGGSWLVRSVDFTAADPLEVLGIFDNKYLNYKVYLTYFGSVQTVLGLRMFSATNTEYTLSNYFRYGFSYSGAGTFTNQIVSGANSITLATHVTSSAQQTSVEMTFFHPNSNSQRKYVHVQWFEAQTGTMVFYQCQVVDNLAFTGLRLDAASGSITGKVRVYGLRD